MVAGPFGPMVVSSGSPAAAGVDPGESSAEFVALAAIVDDPATSG